MYFPGGPEKKGTVKDEEELKNKRLV